MKEKVKIANQYGFQAQVTHNVYEFSDKPSWVDRAIEFITWSSILAIIAFAITIVIY